MESLDIALKRIKAVFIYNRSPRGIATTVFQNVGALRLRGWGIATLKLGHCD